MQVNVAVEAAACRSLDGAHVVLVLNRVVWLSVISVLTFVLCISVRFIQKSV